METTEKELLRKLIEKAAREGISSPSPLGLKDEELPDESKFQLHEETGEVMAEEDDVHVYSAPHSTPQAEDEESTIKALAGLAYSTAKASGASDSLALKISQDYEQTIRSVFGSHAGTEHWEAEGRSVGAAPAKHTVEPGRSGVNTRGKNPDITREPETYTPQGLGRGVQPQAQSLRYADNPPSRIGGEGSSRGGKPETTSDIQPTSTDYFSGRGGHRTPDMPVASPGKSGISKSMKEIAFEQVFDTTLVGTVSGNLPSNSDYPARGIVPLDNSVVKKEFKGDTWEKIARSGTTKEIARSSPNDLSYAEQEPATQELRKNFRKFSDRLSKGE